MTAQLISTANPRTYHKTPEFRVASMHPNARRAYDQRQEALAEQRERERAAREQERRIARFIPSEPRPRIRVQVGLSA